MSDVLISSVKKYFIQQADLGMPDYFFLQKTTEILKLNEIQHANTVQSTTGVIKKKDIFPLLPNDDGDFKKSDTSDTYVLKRKALVSLYYEFKLCERCSLSKTRTKMVFGSGNANASLLIIGEAPGYEEDIQGKPFVGKAGALLTKMLSAIHISRDTDTFVTNILKCRPPENRDPNAQEDAACAPILKRQIDIIQPKVILLLGRIAAQSLLSKPDGVGRLRKDIHLYKQIPVVVTYHPAALLRYNTYKKYAWEDLQRLQKLLY